MKKKSLLMSLFLLSWFNLFSLEPDILVTKEGESLKVYYLDVTSSENVYFSIEEDSTAPLRKILKSDILIIKKADGEIIIPNKETSQNSVALSHNIISLGEAQENYNPIIFESLEEDFTLQKTRTIAQDIFNDDYIKSIKGRNSNKKKPKEEYQILIGDSLGNVLNARLISELDRKLAITIPRLKQKYNFEEIIIPDSVSINKEMYAVTQIDDAFSFGKNKKSITLRLPNTLEVIGERAFANNKKISRIILPESLKKIGEYAFFNCGHNSDVFYEIYIPSGIEEIGYHAFLEVGKERSPRGYYQGVLTGKPGFINGDNCQQFGIDDNAVEDYERRIGIRK